MLIFVAKYCVFFIALPLPVVVKPICLFENFEKLSVTWILERCIGRVGDGLLRTRISSTKRDVSETLGDINTKKSTGIEVISRLLLKDAGETVMESPIVFFNRSLRTRIKRCRIWLGQLLHKLCNPCRFANPFEKDVHSPHPRFHYLSRLWCSSIWFAKQLIIF